MNTCMTSGIISLGLDYYDMAFLVGWGTLMHHIKKITFFSFLLYVLLLPSWPILSPIVDHLNYSFTKSLDFFHCISAAPAQSKHKRVLKRQPYYPSALLEKLPDPARLAPLPNASSPNSTVYSEQILSLSFSCPFPFLQLKIIILLKFPSIWDDNFSTISSRRVGSHHAWSTSTSNHL